MAGTGFTPLGVTESSSVFSAVLEVDPTSVALVEDAALVAMLSEGDVVPLNLLVDVAFSVTTVAGDVVPLSSIDLAGIVSTLGVTPDSVSVGVLEDRDATVLAVGQDSWLVGELADTTSALSLVLQEALALPLGESPSFTSTLQSGEVVGVHLLDSGAFDVLRSAAESLKIDTTDFALINDTAPISSSDTVVVQIEGAVGEDNIFVTNALILYGVRVAWNDEIKPGSWEIEESHERKFFGTKI